MKNIILITICCFLNVLSYAQLTISDEYFKACLGKYCIIEQNYRTKLTTVDSISITPWLYNKIQFASDEGCLNGNQYFEMHDTGGWYLVDTNLKHIIDYIHPTNSQFYLDAGCRYVRVRNGKYFGLFSIDGNQILQDSLFERIKISYHNPEFIFAFGSGEWKLFDNKGEKLINEKIVNIKEIRSGIDFWKVDLEDRTCCFVGKWNNISSIKRFKNIEIVKSYIIFTLDDEEQFKMLLISRDVPKEMKNFSDKYYLSEPIYKELCFDRKCSESLLNKAQTEASKKHMTMILGKTKDGNFHSFNGSCEIKELE